MSDLLQLISVECNPKNIHIDFITTFLSKYGKCALIEAITKNPYLAHLLILDGFDVNFLGNSRYSPLHIAIGNIDMKLFTNNGVRDTIPKNQVFYDIVVELVKNGADINHKENHFNTTPFYHLPEGEFKDYILRLSNEYKKWLRRKNAMIFFSNITCITGNIWNSTELRSSVFQTYNSANAPLSSCNISILKTPISNIQELASNTAFNAHNNAFISIKNITSLKHIKKERSLLSSFSQKNIQHNIIKFL